MDWRSANETCVATAREALVSGWNTEDQIPWKKPDISRVSRLKGQRYSPDGADGAEPGERTGGYSRDRGLRISHVRRRAGIGGPWKTG